MAGEDKAVQRKPRLTATRIEDVNIALVAAAAAQTAFWDAMSELETVVGFEFCMDDADLENYAGNAELFLDSAWEARDGR